MDICNFIKDCVLTFNYPLAHSMNEEEIADIFKTSNRCFLISWMLKLLDSAYEEILENCENNKEFLSNLVHELGFCSEKDKLPFMNGELPVDQQVKIIFNIFKFIIDIKKDTKEETELSISCDEVTALVNTELNLFPMYGEIRLLKPSERNLKMLEKEKDAVNVDQSADSEINQICLLDNMFKDDVQRFIEMLRMEFPKIKYAMENVSKNRDMETHKTIELKSDSVDTLRKCCENMKVISQFIKDINIIEDFEKRNVDFVPSQNVCSSNVQEMVKILYREVLSVLKYSRCL